MGKLSKLFEKVGESQAKREDVEGEIESASETAWYKMRPTMLLVVRWVAIAFAAFHLYTAITVPLPAMIQRSVHLGFAAFLVFILFPLKTKAGKHLWPVDILFAVLAMVSTSYIVLNYSTIAARIGSPTVLDTVLGVVLVLVVLEGTRRTVGPAMPIIAICFLLYAYFGNIMPSIIGHRGYNITRISSNLYLSTEGIFGTPLGVSATFVAVFVIFGVMLQNTGGADFIMRFAIAAFGHVRGGPAKIATVSSALFGTLSGSVVANVVTTGTFTIPMMKKTGYSAEYAGAVEAVASTGGMIMPPVMGAAAFIMAEILGRSYWDIVIAAALPGILYYISLWTAVDLRAASQGLKGVPRSTLESPFKVLKSGWSFIIPIAVLIGLLSGPKFSAIKAGLWAVVACFVVGLFNKDTRLGLKKLLKVLETSGRGLVEVAMGCACAGIIIGVFSLTGLGLKLSAILISLSGGHMLPLLLLTMVCCLILGMGVTTTAAYIVLVVLVAPALVQMGILPIAAHMFIFHIGAFANITPPVALGAYAAAAVAKASPMTTGLIAFRLAIPALLIPFLFVYNPVLLMQGTGFDIVLAVVTSVLGIFFMAAGLEGYLLRKMSWPERLILLTGAFLMVVPGWQTDVIGLVILVVSVLYQRASVKNNVQSA